MCLKCRHYAITVLVNAMTQHAATLATEGEQVAAHHLCDEIAFLLDVTKPPLDAEERDEAAVAKDVNESADKVIARLARLTTPALLLLGKTAMNMAVGLTAIENFVGDTLTARADDGDPECQSFSTSAIQERRKHEIMQALAGALATSFDGEAQPLDASEMPTGQPGGSPEYPH